MQTLSMLKHYTDAPMVMITGHPDTGCTAEFIHAGGASFLLKPIEIERLGDQLQSVIALDMEA